MLFYSFKLYLNIMLGGFLAVGSLISAAEELIDCKPLSQEEAVKAVEDFRAENNSVFKKFKEPYSKYFVKKDFCHVSYVESKEEDISDYEHSPYAFIVSPEGIVVNAYKGYSRICRVPKANAAELSLNEMRVEIEFHRKNSRQFPRQLEDSEVVQGNRSTCYFRYSEKTKIPRRRASYLFNYHGGLAGYYFSE